MMATLYPRGTRTFPVGFFILLAMLCFIQTRTALAQSGRYEGTTRAGQAFERGQAQSAEGDRLLADGQTDRASRAYTAAERAYREALEIEPGYLEAIERIAYIMYVTDRHAEAVELLEEASRTNPGYLPFRRLLGINLYELGQTERAVEILLAVDEQGAATADVFFILGKHYYDQRDYSNAIPYFRRYLVENPADAATHGALGNAYLRTEQYELALAGFRTVIELAPDNMAARINIGEVYYASEDYPRAIEVYNYITERDPDNVRIWFNLGNSHTQLGQHAEALTAYENMVRLREDLFQGHYFTGTALLELNRYDEAAEALQRSVERDSDHDMSHYRLGLAQTRLGQREDAAASFARAREIKPDEPWYAWGEGNLRRQMGQYTEALSLHLEALEGDDTVASFHESLGRDYYALSNVDNAIESLTRALELDAELTSAKNALSVALLARIESTLLDQRLDEASELVARLSELGTHPTYSAIVRAMLHLARSDLSAAENALDEVASADRELLLYRRVASQLHLQRGNPREIGTLLSDLDQTSPASLDPRDAALLAHAAASRNRWEQAISLFERARTIDSGYDQALAICHLRSGLDQAGRGRWRDAEGSFNSASNLSSGLPAQDRVRIRYALGIAQIHTGAWDRAVRNLNDVRSDLRNFRGDRSRLPRRNEGLEIEPRLAYAMYRAGQYSNAIELLGSIRGSAATFGELLTSAHINLAERALEQGDTSAARRHFESALRSSPNDPVLRNNYACLLYQGRDRREAGRIWRELADSSEPAVAIFNYAIYLDDVANEPADAYRQYRRYVERGGPSADLARTWADSKAEVFGLR